MAGLGTIATTAIITKGLHMGGACEGMITTHFSLYCQIEVIPPVPSGAGGGGYYPKPAWNVQPDIHDFYQPVEDIDKAYEIPRDQEADYFRKKVNVVLKIDLGDIHIEKTYRVTEKRSFAVVRLFNLINATKERLSVSITKLKRLATKAKVTITNLIKVK